jgi:RNA polymerase sigma-70 factor (ECF subfamily)
MVDQRYFLRMFLPVQPNLRAFVGSLVRNRQAREDLLQDIALTLWEKMSEYDEGASFSAWARAIAANKVRQHWDKVGRRPVCFSPEVVQAISDAFATVDKHPTDAADALAQCLKEVPDKLRRLLELRYNDSHSIKEIASIVGGAEVAIYKALARLRGRLRECVERRLSVKGE